MSNITVEEALEFVPPESRALLKGILARLGKPTTIPAREMIVNCLGDNTLTTDENLAVISLQFINRNKFAPKMNRLERCEVLALYHAGFGRDVLSKMYKVDRRTIAHIYTPTSPHYKAIRDERIGLGPDKFRETYLTPEVINKAKQFLTDMALPEANNRHANKKQGVHIVKPPQCTYNHRLVIQWVDAGDHKGVTESGWYYKDLDSDFPDDWFTAGGPESLKNSLACYSAALADITDKL